MLSPQFSNNQKLTEAIISVVAFFDLFDYPLTAFEIWGHLGKKQWLSEIIDVLDANTNIFSKKSGFYCFIGRTEIIFTRQERYNYSCRKIKIARLFVRVFSLCPYIKVVALANSIGANNLRDGSDIDFFIITSPGKIWISRLYCTGLAKLLNCRPTTKNKRDKICLSFYISEDHLDLEDLRLQGADPYFDYWRQGLFLLYNKNEVYERFLAKNNLNSLTKVFSKTEQPAHLSFFEKAAKKIQLLIMPRLLIEANNNSDGVVINDQVLKLYQHDRRREYAEKYGDKINEIITKNS